MYVFWAAFGLPPLTSDTGYVREITVRRVVGHASDTAIWVEPQTSYGSNVEDNGQFLERC